MNTEKEWFTSWFDTPYYHILYKHRNDTEAHLFMKNLVSFLQLNKHTNILDLACGKGRHAIYLNSLGYKVYGADLSKNNIAHAKNFENDSLQFFEHDMRNPIPMKFDAIFNLFTSFGFFEKDEEDIAVLQHIKNALSENGIAVIDFLNIHNATKNLVTSETVHIDDIDFHITRTIENQYIVKKIQFTHKGEPHEYFERVKLLDLPKITSYLTHVGFAIQHVFGDYQLNSFNEKTSERLILVLK